MRVPDATGYDAGQVRTGGEGGGAGGGRKPQLLYAVASYSKWLSGQSIYGIFYVIQEIGFSLVKWRALNWLISPYEMSVNR